MRKILLLLLMFIALTSNVAFATKLPDDIQKMIQTSFPKSMFRFDGVVILPDATIYLPLIPAKTFEVENVQIKSTIPANKQLSQKPEAIIFNNNYVLMRVINDANGKRTLISPNPAPAEIANGLLPQDILVPRNFIVPENLKGIIGNLNIELSQNSGLKVATQQPKNSKNSIVPIPELKGKVFYVATGYSKDIQVINAESKSPAYALSQNHVPNDMKEYKNEYLLVTSYDTDTMNVISLIDEDIIKQIQFPTRPEQIIIDDNIAYVSSPMGECIYIVNLDNMTLSKQIKINGMCERLVLSDDKTKMFYFDKKTNEIWAIELDNNYLLKDIGKFPNVSSIAYNNNKIYITSRTKGHLAIVDYETNGLMAEIPITQKPVDMLVYENNLYILGALENVIQVIDTTTDELTDTIYLNLNGFSSKLNKIPDSNLALVSDSKASIYCILNLKSKQIVKASAIEVPIRTIVMTKQVIKTNK